MDPANFIKGYEEAFDELFLIHKSTGVNSKGNDLRMPIAPLGVNIVTLTEVKLKQKGKTMFIQLSYQPDPVSIDGKKERIAPISATYFEESVNDCGKLYGHVFAPRPADMSKQEYLQHICRRMMTWIGRKTEVAAVYDKSIIRDDYGRLEPEGFGQFAGLRRVYYPRLIPVGEFNWLTAIRVAKKDKDGYEKWYLNTKGKIIPFSWQTFE